MEAWAAHGRSEDLDVLRSEARAAAMYVVHLRAELERCRGELRATRAELDRLVEAQADGAGDEAR